MLPTDSGYLERPNKRARGSGTLSGPSSDSPPPSSSHVANTGNEQVLSGISQQAGSSTIPNLALGPTSVARVRGEDRSRKLSCKECRRRFIVRTKTLVNHNVSLFQSCVKRGCGSLCPEGALTAGRGSRFILANTETLHDKITELSDRVRQLEEALERLQQQCSTEPHPLLAPDLLKIKTSQELYGTAPLPPPSSLTKDAPSPTASSSRPKDDRSLPDSVVALSLGNHAGTVPITRKPATVTGNRPSSPSSAVVRREITPPEVPPDILQLSSTFPFPWMVDLSIRKRIRDALPPREEAEIICAEARNNALWQFNMDTSETFLPNLLHYCYTTPIENLSPRRLALLLMILSIGSLVDLKKPLGSLHGEAYHHLARASVCEIPLMEEPDFDVLHALFFMIYYHLIFSDNKKAVGYAWNLMGFVAKLAQGVYRDGARSSKLIPEEHERRRAIFWELLNMDCRMSLSLGRPPSIYLAHVDAKRPSYVGVGIYVPREEIVYHNWKNDFFVECLSPILETMINTVHPPSYTHILELDRSVRDFAIPALLEEQNTKPTPRYLVMQRGLVAMGREIGVSALLQLHRRYFTQAMNNVKPFDMNHEHAPSVLATYLSASTLIATVEELYEREQNLSVRFLHFWFNVFSAAVMLSLFISRAPTTPLATFALQDLERICQIFQRVTSVLPFCVKVLPHITKLAEKGRLTLRHNATSGSLAPIGNPYPITLPSSFAKAHHVLGNHAERMRLNAPMVRPRGGGGSEHAGPSSISSATSSHTARTRSVSPVSPLVRSDTGQLPESLPDIYHFSSSLVDIDERYGFTPISVTGSSSSSRKTQNFFVPSSPRIAEDEKFNFDHGALTSELEETSYMAWF
ncbi:hypothetical protein AN958_01778 [Leucoagaricus sp. SymC.cos]|nr:hypothetical protein AN958_01778 [Leucoagaricus sp. SymC.cos]